MRVTDLDDEVMESVCKELRRTRPDGNIFILGSHDQEGHALPSNLHEAGGTAKSGRKW